jgi:hypothetical protein
MQIRQAEDVAHRRGRLHKQEVSLLCRTRVGLRHRGFRQCEGGEGRFGGE